MYQEYVPDIRLSHLIECYWTFNGYIDGQIENRVLPDGCVDIIFTFNGENGQGTSRHVQPGLVGTMTGCSVFTYTNKIDMMGIRFNPGGIKAFTRMPVDEITNSFVELRFTETLFGKDIFEELPDKKTIHDRIAYVDDYLIKKMQNSFALDDQILFSIDIIKRFKGCIGIEELSAQVCLSQRQLERRFKSAVGISPKTFSRIMKFKNAVDLLRTQPQQNLYHAAIECGYYDHAHFIKEFKVLSGRTPLAYM